MTLYDCSLNRKFDPEVTSEIDSQDPNHAAVTFFRRQPLLPLPCKVWVRYGSMTLVVEVTPVGRILQGIV